MSEADQQKTAKAAKKKTPAKKKAAKKKTPTKKKGAKTSKAANPKADLKSLKRRLTRS